MSPAASASPAILADLPVPALLPPDLRQLVVDRFEPVAVAFGSVIVREGDPADALYVIASGRARVLKHGARGEEIPLNVLRPGDSFGKIGLLGRGGRTATVRASSDVEAFKLDRAEFDELVERQLLAEVACAEARLVAELTLPRDGVSWLRPGLGAKLLYDAFPHQRHGDVADATIRVDGQGRPLIAGMTGQAEVVVGRRALITYVFEPLRQLRENLAGALPAAAASAGSTETAAASTR